MSKVLIEIGFSRWNEENFHISSAIADLSLEEMQRLRRIIPVAIFVAEDMWHREQERKNPAASSAVQRKGESSQ